LVVKAYDTSVGKRPLIGRMPEDLETVIQDRGHEAGVTSGRKRQCLWHNTVIDRKVDQVGMPTWLVINKGDVLTGVDPMYTCDALELDGETITELPTSILELQRCKAVLTEHPGWDEDFMGATEMDQLPHNFRNFLASIAGNWNAKLKMIGTGPLREHMVVL
jgi:adenylosuccinate synthase